MLPVNHDFAVVMTQDCDLLRDFNRRHQGKSESQPNILLCDAYYAASLRAKVQEDTPLSSKEWKVVTQNSSERFQYLQRVEPVMDMQREGLPPLAMDFRNYFTVPTEELYHRLIPTIRRRARLNTPYVEHLAQRFFKFHARVALPVDHVIETAQT